MDVFFFSSRRRHTRFDCDWSSDVCSSDLVLNAGFIEQTSQLFDVLPCGRTRVLDRKSTRLNSSHSQISYAVFCLKKKKTRTILNESLNAHHPLLILPDAYTRLLHQPSH